MSSIVPCMAVTVDVAAVEISASMFRLNLSGARELLRTVIGEQHRHDLALSAGPPPWAESRTLTTRALPV